MSKQESTGRRYPRQVVCGGVQLEVAPLRTTDREALAALVATLPAHDLLFLRRDISHPKVLDAWMLAIETGELASLVARAEDGTLVGCTAIFTDPLSWSRHVGELRVLTSPEWRGRGLGRVLIQECFAQALELELTRLVAQMTTDQRAAIAVFEDLGFKAEALLAGHVIDREGRPHDLVLLAHDVRAVAARNVLYGMSEALGG
ncbi:MAG: GNAT family N-acetyltransferase [Proteobacteria bacterium]|nr:GNAT family N-acetyltransferase [Pseudomonadota bacterium]